MCRLWPVICLHKIEAQNIEVNVVLLRLSLTANAMPRWQVMSVGGANATLVGLAVMAGRVVHYYMNKA